MMVENSNDQMANILGVAEAENIAFTPNATTAINTIIHGMDLKGDKVLVSPMEHNAVMRPLHVLAQQGLIEIGYLPALPDGRINIEALPNQQDRNVKLICCVHQSNVNGAIQPIEALFQWVGDVPVMVDATQSAGYIPVMGDAWGAEAVVFTGHKGLLGPTGTGGFYIRHPQRLQPFIQGGTGSNSDSFNLPESMPDRFQAGTPNLLGLAGLLGALNANVEKLHSKNDFLSLLKRVRNLQNIDCYCGNDINKVGELFSFRVENENPGITAHKLFTNFGIETRSGLHCAPLAHRTLGSFPAGLVRISLSPYHTPADLEFLFQALKDIAK